MNVEGNGATLKLDTSAYPHNETVFYNSPVTGTSYNWSGNTTTGQNTFPVSISTSLLNPGDTVFLQLGTDPYDGTQPHYAQVCQVTANTGTSITVNVSVPLASFTQGARQNSIERITDVIQNTTFDNVRFDYFTGTTPDTNLWISMAKNVAVTNLTGNFTIMTNITDSQGVSIKGCNGTLNKLASSSGRMVTGWQDDNLVIGTAASGNTVSDAYDSSIIFLESWSRNTTITNLNVTQTYVGVTASDIFHFAGGSSGTFADSINITNTSGVNLEASGTDASSYSFGTVTISGAVKSAPLWLINKLITGGHTYDASNTTTSSPAPLTIGSSWTDFQQALCTGVVRSMTFTLTSLTGVSSIFVNNSNNKGSNLIGKLAAGVPLVLPQFFGTDYAFNDPLYLVKTMHFYTGTVPPGTTLTWSVTYYN